MNNAEQQTNTIIYTDLPPFDSTDASEKIKAGVWAWRYEAETGKIFLDVKELNGAGTETGKVFPYEFTETQLGKIGNGFKGRMLQLDSQILQSEMQTLSLKEAKEVETQKFDAEYAVLINGFKETNEKAAKKSKK